jgi:hypothetical protein
MPGPHGRRIIHRIALPLSIMLAACEGSDVATAVPPAHGNGAFQGAVEGEKPLAAQPTAQPTAEPAAPYVGTLGQEVAVPEALLTGALRIRDNCLVFDSGGQVSLAVVPAGTRLDAGRSRVTIGGAALPLGKEMQFGGGSYPVGHEVFGKLTKPVPGNCPRSGTLIGDIVR